jgi:hypothetical protein
MCYSRVCFAVRQLLAGIMWFVRYFTQLTTCRTYANSCTVDMSNQGWTVNVPPAQALFCMLPTCHVCAAAGLSQGANNRQLPLMLPHMHIPWPACVPPATPSCKLMRSQTFAGAMAAQTPPLMHSHDETTSPHMPSATWHVWRRCFVVRCRPAAGGGLPLGISDRRKLCLLIANVASGKLKGALEDL